MIPSLSTMLLIAATLTVFGVAYVFAGRFLDQPDQSTETVGTRGARDEGRAARPSRGFKPHPRRRPGDGSGGGEARRPALVEMNDLTCAYGSKVVLRDVTMRVNDGEMVGIVGPSGAGKTTLLRAMLGNTRPLAGTVTLHRDGRPVEVGYVPQVDAIDRTFPATVRDVVAMGLAARRLFRRPWLTRRESRIVDATLAELGIAELADRPIGEVSGGQQQRAFLARALVRDPDILLLDEPTSSIDLRARHELMEVLRHLASEGIAIVLTTHDLNGIAARLPRIVCLSAGHVVAMGTPAEVLVPALLEKAYGAPFTVVMHDGVPVVAEAEVSQAANDGSAGPNPPRRRRRRFATGASALAINHASSSHPAVSLAGVVKYYPSPDGGTVTALAIESFVVRPGEALAVTGPSGSGKTTLLHVIAGIIPVSAGQLHVDGHETSAMGEAERDELRGRSVGIIMQSNQLLSSFSALENVMLAMDMVGKVPADAREGRARMLLTRLGLAERLHHRPAQLSGGQQQRVAIARALANGPAVVVADEPTAHVDGAMAMTVIDILVQECREHGASLVVATHDLRVRDRFDRVIDLGRLPDSRPEHGTGSGPEARLEAHAMTGVVVP